mmetsp:Transcript_3325/g.9462  ORF Transcript_3325/g.9462 Transcript_3325/m.9462 type:complete len:361 (-) Transcript_3325:625-1707(-)
MRDGRRRGIEAAGAVVEGARAVVVAAFVVFATAAGRRRRHDPAHLVLLAELRVPAYPLFDELPARIHGLGDLPRAVVAAGFALRLLLLIPPADVRIAAIEVVAVVAGVPLVVALLVVHLVRPHGPALGQHLLLVGQAQHVRLEDVVLRNGDEYLRDALVVRLGLGGGRGDRPRRGGPALALLLVEHVPHHAADLALPRLEELAGPRLQAARCVDDALVAVEGVGAVVVVVSGGGALRVVEEQAAAHAVVVVVIAVLRVVVAVAAVHGRRTLPAALLLALPLLHEEQRLLALVAEGVVVLRRPPHPGELAHAHLGVHLDLARLRERHALVVVVVVVGLLLLLPLLLLRLLLGGGRHVVCCL